MWVDFLKTEKTNGNKRQTIVTILNCVPNISQTVCSGYNKSINTRYFFLNNDYFSYAFWSSFGSNAYIFDQIVD